MNGLTEEQIKELFEKQQQDVADLIVKWNEEASKIVGGQLEKYCEYTNKTVLMMSDNLSFFQTRMREFEERLNNIEKDFEFYKINHTTTTGEFCGLRHDFDTFVDSFKNEFDRNLEFKLEQEGFILGKIPCETMEPPML